MKTTSSSHKSKTITIAILFGMICSLVLPLRDPPALAQDAPNPLAPAEGVQTDITNYPPLGIPEFSWSPVEEATLYRLQASPDPGFATIPLDITTANTRYTPLSVSSSLFYDHEWYWRVRVEKPTASAYSLPMRFEKLWASPENFPNLIAPAENASLDFYGSQIFSWEPVTGAARYRFQIAASSDGFNTPLYNQLTLATQHQPPTKLSNGSYYWRVIPLDPGDNQGTPSEVRSFHLSYGSSGDYPGEIPVLLEPADDSFPTFTPTFRWTAVQGVQTYRLEYTTDPTCYFGAGTTTVVESKNTTYTPTIAFPNDVNYCWRVQARSGNSISDWSETWNFIKKWYIQPELLTPRNGYQYVSEAFFSWTPVPGAARYKIEVNLANSFPPVNPGWTEYTTNPYFVKPDKALGGAWYWRVTPIDFSNNLGKPSAVSSFNGIQPLSSADPVPQLIYPLYYFTPSGSLSPHEDRTVAQPVFMWHRILTGTLMDQVAAYRIEVDDQENFGSVDWRVDTENLSAVPTLDHPFHPVPGAVYNWRVCVLDYLGGNCLTDPDNGRPLWSDVWRAHIDPDLALPSRSTIQLIRPEDGSESVETTPLLEWWPLSGAVQYELEISPDPAFSGSSIVDQTVITYTAYTPFQHLDYYPQDGNSDLPYGTYYWRVRGLDAGGAPVAGWSPAWRFQIAAQSRWLISRNIGNLDNRRQVAYDPDDVALDDYELTSLNVTQSASYWFFGFNASTIKSNRAYGLYLDLDHQANSGATLDPHGNQVSTIPVHQPEYAIYLTDNGTASYQVMVYKWEGANWGTGQDLLSLGGGIYTDTTYVEAMVPSTIIGMEETTGSLALSLFSVDEATGLISDTVPEGNPNVLDRFVSVSERLSLAMPPTNATGDLTTFPSIPPFFWQWPPVVPWEGYRFEVSLDEQFTTIIYSEQVTSLSQPYLASAVHTPIKDFNGDNTYYWRVRPQYWHPSINLGGAWSESGRIERDGFAPLNLRTEISPTVSMTDTFTTPTFAWDRVEGAAAYEIQVDNDPNFSSPEINSVITPQTTYTPPNTLNGGAYSWRVRTLRSNNSSAAIKSDWTLGTDFRLSLPIPKNLSVSIPAPAQGLASPPIYCWEPLMVSIGSLPVFSAWKYKVEVSKDANFSTIYDKVDGTEQTCWASTKGYDNGAYYWHVAMYDGSGRLGPYSTNDSFTKTYPITTLLSPTNGSQVNSTPTFSWSPVSGAAKYILEISLDENFSPLYESRVTTVNTSYTPVKQYEFGKFYWHVAIVDRDGKTGAFNDAVLRISTLSNPIYLPVLFK